ncbi:MetQ/NlpA family ABC transporter substrate-binding protein [Clostridium algoriphilum]|uniref:MetQ/NlpA family ABC transporter substrate-binding protein n=1 Tax=Clostridium algoriphilum TaxID=198347 RepID=UPI001CF159D4|nr:MetQ/NlpA family ABC transporter substrate-binding protein [Clostridium algoriphilum]MCB2294395.1 MetQ/NlpA family ABC transporter substrate-binding protein [Clostridium algoriphilum]
MEKGLFTKIVTIMSVGVLILGVSGCGKSNSSASNDKKKELRVGVSAGPYNDLFNSVVKPILEKKGYTVKLVNFSNLLLSEVALTEDSIDLNVAQHTAYMNNFNKEKNAHLLPIVHIPTVPAGIFSDKFKTIKDVKAGAKIAIPKDPSNTARAYNLLQKAGWIKLKAGIDPMSASKSDIIENPHNLNITLMDSAQIPRAMKDIDFAVLPGSIVYSSHIDASKSLLSENIVKDLEITAVVNKGKENSVWAKDIVAAYKSDEFKKYMKEHNKNNYWVIPDGLK